MFCQSRGPIPEDVEYTRYFNETIKLLLLGTGESGKTTIKKQMKILHINGFSEEERKASIKQIKQNIHESIYDILYNMDKINPPAHLKNETSQPSVEYLFKIGQREPEEYSQEYYDHVKIAWEDPGVKETFQRSNEYQLIDSAEHFLNRVDIIRQPDYVPTTQDILFCREMTVNISKIEFSIKVPRVFGGGTANFWMFDVGGQRGERKKWIRVFEGIQAILFLIAASDFDQTLREDQEKNRLEEAFGLFEDIYCSRFVREAGLIVFLNKQDLLRRKIEQGRKLENYFPEYKNFQPGAATNNEYERARMFMQQKIMDCKKIPLSLDRIGFVPGKRPSDILPPREIYLHSTIATDTNNIKKVFESVQEIILKINIGSITNQPF